MESQTEITCIPLQHELKQETIKSALEADVYTAWKNIPDIKHLELLQ